MPDAEQGYGNRGFASAIRRVFQNHDVLRPTYDIPQDLRDKLAELDRVTSQGVDPNPRA